MSEPSHDDLSIATATAARTCGLARRGTDPIAEPRRAFDRERKRLESAKAPPEVPSAANLIDRTVAVWRTRSRRELRCEDAQQIIETVTISFRILSHWSRVKIPAPANSINDFTIPEGARTAHARGRVPFGRKNENENMHKLLNASEMKRTTLPATHNENPWLEAASEANNDIGRLLKCVKGEWMVGDDVLPENVEYVAHVDQIVRGWVRFEDGKVIDRAIGKIADGYKPPQREELPDNDPESWTEKDANGEPRDPWVAQWFLPLIALETGDFVTFVTGSKGGIAAIATLCRIYGRKHRDGRIETPDLPIVGWEGASTATPTSAAAGDPSDAIPF